MFFSPSKAQRDSDINMLQQDIQYGAYTIHVQAMYRTKKVSLLA